MEKKEKKEYKLTICYKPKDFKCNSEELGLIKNAINSEKNYVDLVRGDTRVKVNLRNFTYIEEKIEKKK